MKIKYEKPLVAVEHYELSQAIASCIIKIGPRRGDAAEMAIIELVWFWSFQNHPPFVGGFSFAAL